MRQDFRRTCKDRRESDEVRDRIIDVHDVLAMFRLRVFQETAG